MEPTTSTSAIRVLVVEDDPLLLMLGVSVLEDAGFEAVEAESGDAAMDILRSDATFDVLFSDVDMPGKLNGIDLAALVRARWPLIEIIITSGHMAARVADLPDRAVFFPKPYDARTVVKTIRTMSGQKN